jgi:hypothetical protein
MKGKCLDEDLGKEGLRKGYLLHLQSVEVPEI